MKLRRQLKQDRRAIEARLDQKDRYMSSLEKIGSSDLPNRTVQFSQRKPMLKMITKNNLEHF
jgi:hypothetical protein